jgi:hypothetical protein
MQTRFKATLGVIIISASYKTSLINFLIQDMKSESMVIHTFLPCSRGGDVITVGDKR